MDSVSDPKPKPHRGIYLLPNLFTTGALFSGFYAVLAAFAGNYVDAAIAVFVAGILDSLDGRVARLTNTQSEFGVQYDSLSDMCSFGIAPAVVMYCWSLSTLKPYGPFWGKLGFGAAFVYAACAALRLARFNTQVGVADKRYFQGLASPAAAGLCMSFVWTMENFGIEGQWLCFFTPVLAAVAVGLPQRLEPRELRRESARTRGVDDQHDLAALRRQLRRLALDRQGFEVVDAGVGHGGSREVGVCNRTARRCHGALPRA